MEDKREQILQTALTLFVDNGYHGTPTSKIAKEAGVATGTLFHYFKTKEDLINSLYLHLKRAMLEATKSAFDDSRSVKENLKNFLFYTVSFFLENKYAFLFFKQYYASPFVSDQTRKEGVRIFSEVSDLLEQSSRQGIFKDVPWNLLQDLMSSLLMGTCEHFLEHPAKFRDEAYKELVFSLIWNFARK